MEAIGAGLQKAWRFHEKRRLKQKEDMFSFYFHLEFTQGLYYHNFVLKSDEEGAPL